MKLIVSTFLVYKVKKCLLKSGKVRMLMSGMKSSRSSCLFHHSMIFPILRLTKKKRLLNLSAVVLPLIMSLENGSSRKECLYKKNFCHTLRERVNSVILRSSPLHGLLGKQQLRAFVLYWNLIFFNFAIEEKDLYETLL